MRSNAYFCDNLNFPPQYDQVKQEGEPKNSEI